MTMLTLFDRYSVTDLCSLISLGVMRLMGHLIGYHQTNDVDLSVLLFCSSFFTDDSSYASLNDVSHGRTPHKCCIEVFLPFSF